MIDIKGDLFVGTSKFYEKRDKKIAREKQGYQENMTAEEAKLEKEKMAMQQMKLFNI